MFRSLVRRRFSASNAHRGHSLRSSALRHGKVLVHKAWGESARWGDPVQLDIPDF